MRAKFVTEAVVGDKMIIVNSLGKPLGEGVVESIRGSFFYINGERYYRKGLDGKHHKLGDMSVSAMAVEDAMGYIPASMMEELRDFDFAKEWFEKHSTNLETERDAKDSYINGITKKKFIEKTGLARLESLRKKSGKRKPMGRKTNQGKNRKPEKGKRLLDIATISSGDSIGEKTGTKPVDFDEIKRKIAADIRKMEKEAKANGNKKDGEAGQAG